ncbi:hypothetical protein L9F63_004621, partial [Diploptera punctata]
KNNNTLPAYGIIGSAEGSARYANSLGSAVGSALDVLRRYTNSLGSAVSSARYTNSFGSAEGSVLVSLDVLRRYTNSLGSASGCFMALYQQPRRKRGKPKKTWIEGRGMAFGFRKTAAAAMIPDDDDDQILLPKEINTCFRRACSASMNNESNKIIFWISHKTK